MAYIDVCSVCGRRLADDERNNRLVVKIDGIPAPDGETVMLKHPLEERLEVCDACLDRFQPMECES